ncbi:sigma-54-dependent Fis family transcriptional regulator [Geotalea uraniireducens]|uniref:Transcriptional regulator, NifA subfamily, Fis Family n=1 Tax=Geotalea uraniireducens (strain Rf4) TaxID=351605 RepID=A5G4X7_GEOUR|nr:sigma 54-interacting transcriptional regulator [Geotalea uraniireducens]ABQ26845.1 transcriptional regulator, NifA subfamily, Fis Family [Geotalea uraniireducens Rf4]
MQRSALRNKARSKPAAEKILLPIPKAKPRDTMQELLEMERLVSDSMSRIITVSADLVDREIAALLRQMLTTCGFDRCGLMMLTQDKTEVRASHACHGEGIAAVPETYTLRDLFPWTGENLLHGNIVSFSSLAELPPLAEADRRNYAALGVQSYLAIPIYAGGSVEFFIDAHHVRARHIWSKESISLLRLFGEVCANALGGGHDTRNEEVRLQFERFVSDLSVKFINVTADEVDREIIAALEQVREMFQFDGFGLISLSPDKGEAIVSHACYGEGIERSPEKIDISLRFPWTKERLLRGEMIHFNSREDVPEDAAVDRQSWQAMKVKANFSIPILVAGSVAYIIAAHDVRATRCLDEGLLLRLRLLGEIFANALFRCKSEAEFRNSCTEIQRLKEKLQLEAEYLQTEIICSHCNEQIIGQSAALDKVLRLVEQVASTDSTVLICGETGTGKELVARAIQELSLRRNKPIVKVNCASLPAALVESELFGREKGAYTGALTRQAGRFEVADGATIFLDEISEMSPELQAKLLRVLQEGQFERLGSTKTIHVDVRVIAATNRNLAEEVKKGTFREDLYYRLNVFQIVVPPLRERAEDIPLLAWAFVHEFNEKMGKKINRIAKSDMNALQNYHWPGNVRELRNVIEYGVIVSTGNGLHVRLPEGSGEEIARPLLMDEVERQHITGVLQRTGWRIKGENGAARILGMNPSTLYSRMQKLGIAVRNGQDGISP